VTAAGADVSSIYLESFSFSLLCTIEYTHTVLPNFHIVTGYEPGGRYSQNLYLYRNLTINSMSSSALHHLVPKLTGTNYSTWATKMEMVLIRDDLWPIVCEERLRPERPAQEVRQWDSDARKATANIMLCLGEGAEQLVKGTRNPVDLWKKLQKLYEQKGYSSRFFIRKKFYELRLADYAKSDEENAMSLYINAHRSLCQQLRSAGAIIDNETEHQVLLFGLGDSYDSFVIATTQSIRQSAVKSTVPSVRDHCGRGRTAKSPSVRGQDGNGAVFLKQDGDGRQ
jgi:hypothetical protein